MIEYKKCSEVSIDLVYSAFKGGFSDYIIKLEMPKEIFVTRFFGAEGNCLDHSFIALDEDNAIGVILGGIKVYEGIKTMRCGTLAVIPSYRGGGVSQKLMELHKEEAIKNGCRQLFLEVILGNDRAINFYKRLRYEKIYDLNYFTLNDFKNLHGRSSLNIEVKSSNMEELRLVREKVRDVHINWQNDIDYINKSEGQIILGAYINDKLAGIISMNKNTRINFIWVENALRNNRIALNLILEAAKQLNLSKVTLGMPNNASMRGFINHLGFEKDNISQYEMYHTI